MNNSSLVIIMNRFIVYIIMSLFSILIYCKLFYLNYLQFYKLSHNYISLFRTAYYFSAEIVHSFFLCNVKYSFVYVFFIAIAIIYHCFLVSISNRSAISNISIPQNFRYCNLIIAGNCCVV